MPSSRDKQDLHGLDEDGMLVCNPRDREAAHRAQVEGIATEGSTRRHLQKVPRIDVPRPWQAVSARSIVNYRLPAGLAKPRRLESRSNRLRAR
jgi:hypothetical protein